MSLRSLEKALRRTQPHAHNKEVTRRDESSEPDAASRTVPSREEDEDTRYLRIKKTLFVAIGFFAAVLLGSAVLLFSVFFESGAAKVEVLIAAPKEVTRGVPFEVTLTASNDQESILNDASIRINLPPSLVNLGAVSGQTQLINEEMGDIGAGSLTKRTFKLLPVGAVGSVEKINAAVSYLSGRTSRYEVDAAEEVRVANEPLTLEVKMPENILRGSTFEFEVRYTNTTQFDFPDIALQARYPSLFKFSSASIEPESLNNYWRLGSLRAGASGKILVKGTYDGSGSEGISIPMSAFAAFMGRDYLIAESTAQASIAPSPVSLSLFVNGSEDYVARVGDTLSYVIRYENKTGIALSDVVIRAAFSGDMVDTGTFRTNATFDASANELLWNASNVAAFRILDAGASGEVIVSVKLKNSFSSSRVGQRDNAVKVHATFSSPSVPYYMEASKTFAEANLTTKIAGLVTVDAQLFYRDSVAGIVNAGPFPPKSGQPTEYTAHWIVRNFSTDLSNAEVRASLSPGVAFAEDAESTGGSAPEYDAVNNQVVWKIAKIAAGKGSLTAPLEAMFQVRATPSAAHIGQFQPIMGEAVLTATDEFTGLVLGARDAGLSTALPDDKTVGQNGGKVVP